MSSSLLLFAATSVIPARRHRVRPEDVERLLLGPADLIAVGRIERRRARHHDLVESHIRQPECDGLDVQVALQIRVVVRVDDHDRLTGAVDTRRQQARVAIRLLDLLRCVAPRSLRPVDGTSLTAEEISGLGRPLRRAHDRTYVNRMRLRTGRARRGRAYERDGDCRREDNDRGKTRGTSRDEECAHLLPPPLWPERVGPPPRSLDVRADPEPHGARLQGGTNPSNRWQPFVLGSPHQLWNAATGLGTPNLMVLQSDFAHSRGH